MTAYMRIVWNFLEEYTMREVLEFSPPLTNKERGLLKLSEVEELEIWKMFEDCPDLEVLDHRLGLVVEAYVNFDNW